jgi:hypothetical protein
VWESVLWWKNKFTEILPLHGHVSLLVMVELWGFKYKARMGLQLQNVLRLSDTNSARGGHSIKREHALPVPPSPSNGVHEPLLNCDMHFYFTS